MSETVNTRGIVLHYEPWRDYDRRYVVYTEHYGKLRASAIGIRRPKAKLAGVLEPFAETELYFIIGKQYKIGGAVVQQRWLQLQTDLAKHNAAIYMTECMDRLIREGHPDAEIYRLLYSACTWLNHANYTKLLPLSFVVKLVHRLGYDLVHLAKTPEAIKVLRWLVTANYEDIQKLRLEQAVWQTIYAAVHLWLYEYLSDDVQSEQFLV
jgi:DNA repair protein RecO